MHLMSLFNYYLDHMFFPETVINLCHVLARVYKFQTSAKKKKKTITTGLTGELFRLSPCDVISFGCESSIPHIPSNFVEFIAGNGIVYLFRAFKLHPSFLQSGLAEKTNRCHCCTFTYFFNFSKENLCNISFFSIFSFFGARNCITL